MSKEDRIAKREKKKNKKKCDNFNGPGCDIPKRQQRKLIRQEKQAAKQDEKRKNKKGSKKFLAGTHDVHQRKWKEGATEAKSAQATVIQPGDKNIITDVTTKDGVTTTKGYKESDVEGSKTITSTGTGDYDAAINIGMSHDAATRFAEAHQDAYEGDTKTGLRQDYFSRALYKKTKKGLKTQKSYDYSTKGGDDYGRGAEATGLHTKKGSGQQIYKSIGSSKERRRAKKEGAEYGGMSRGEIAMHRKSERKRVRESDNPDARTTKYISAERIQKKKERMDKSMERGKPKNKKTRSYKQQQRQNKKRIKTRDYGTDIESLAKYNVDHLGGGEYDLY